MNYYVQKQRRWLRYGYPPIAISVGLRDKQN